MKRIKIWLIMVAVAVGGVGIAVLTRSSKGDHKEAKDKAENARVIDVKFVQPRKGAIERLSVQPGSVHSFERIQLFARVSGELEYQNVDIESRVKGPTRNALFGTILKEGEVLAKLYVPDLVAQYQRTEAGVEKAQSVLKQTEARVAAAKANKDVADSEVVFAKAMELVKKPYFLYREIQYGRMKDLAAKGAIEARVEDESHQQMNAAKEDLEAAKVKIVTAQANVVSAAAKIKQAEADVKEAEAEIRVAEAEMRKAKVNVDFATITAPFDGVVTYRSMNPGDSVRAYTEGSNMNPLLTVCRTDRFRVVVLVPDRDAPLIKKGLPAMLKIDALPKLTFYPKVSRSAKSLDAHTRLLRVELDVHADGKICTAEQLEQLNNEMYGQATIVLDSGKDLLSIPSGCIAGKIEEGKGSVYVIRSGRAKKIELKLDLDSGLRVVVEKVLTPGETLTENDKVIVEPSSELARQPEVNAVSWDDRATIKLTETSK